MTTGLGLAFRPHDLPREEMSQAQRELEIQITRLEQRLEILNARFMAETHSDRRNSIQREVYAVQTAVDHYRVMQTQQAKRTAY